MTQQQLDHAIARTTGDDLITIRRQGFSLHEPGADLPDDDREPLTVDWDALAVERALATA